MANNFQKAINLAKAKYANNVAVERIVYFLENKQLEMTAYDNRPTFDPLAGYKMGLQGVDGYSFANFSPQESIRLIMHDPLRQVKMLMQADAAFEILVDILNNLGEDLEY